MNSVLGVDLGTSAVKVLLVAKDGTVRDEASVSYPIYHDSPGYSEQDPDDWVNASKEAIKTVMDRLPEGDTVEGISFSGQMHGLVLLDNEHRPIRRAILWNDTRTTAECREIEANVGLDRLHAITKNPALEGFTLPKLMWVKKHEPSHFKEAAVFVLPKDYVRLQLTGELHMDYSDAAGTLLLDVAKKEWSTEMAEKNGIPLSLLPPLIASHGQTGTVTEQTAKETGLPVTCRVFAGGADNACGAIGSGILEEGVTLCSTGTSGVVLSYEASGDKDFAGSVHYFNHGAPDVFYTMGVTLAAGYSLSWYKDTFSPDTPFGALIEEAVSSPAGAKGLLFTPYIVGERTPHPDSEIRGTFTGIQASHTRGDFTRAVIEGITFSLNETVETFREKGKVISKIISIGGGAKSALWLQIQADIFDAEVVTLKSEQGPGMGAAMLAAYGVGWFENLKDCAAVFVDEQDHYQPVAENRALYRDLFTQYQQVYGATKAINHSLKPFRA
ncbi:xylulokinase [Salisediminibacterium selenitireducens]|uniref:Xylulose kinase n=1 Tax=Bacillus selenitireducens (strain ATCC 700615 / DSM 15326 / MLS10) TaxID=439292 RepID=D6XZ31_BACIE|nr:xylulokinase [Salisediminibacterium selenitireducens]ADI00316.1 xylulokinase [[Bacillus] selenitireducens MLS10]